MNIITNLCRLCTSCEGVCLTLNNFDSDNITFLNKLNEIAPRILEDVNNELPNGICKVCIVQLNDAYIFKKKCILSQQILKQFLEQSRNQEVSPERSELHEINLKKNAEFVTIGNEQGDCKSEINCDKFETESNLINSENLDNAGSFEFINVGHLQNNKIKQEDNGLKLEDIVEENIIPPIKEEQIEMNLCNTETDSNDLHEENMIDYSLPSSSTSLIQAQMSEKANQCEICDRAFIGKGDLTRHIRTHTNTRPFKCNTCEKAFKQKEHLRKHIRTHTNEKPFECETCRKTFGDSSTLTRHIRTHTHEKPYVCEICQKTFADSSTLTRHVHTHTNTKQFECGICRKTFGDSGILTRHIRTHTHEKPYVCEICEKAFSDSSNLKIHRRIHSNEKPYNCEVCGKSFRTNGHLKDHIRIHTQEKPYECEICKKSFGQHSQLKRHSRTHTKSNKCEVVMGHFLERNL